MAVGPVAAGVTISLLSLRVGLLADAASFALDALALVGQIGHSSCQEPAEDTPGGLRQAVAYVVNQP